jgi:hypothetical protein
VAAALALEIICDAPWRTSVVWYALAMDIPIFKWLSSIVNGFGVLSYSESCTSVRGKISQQGRAAGTLTILPQITAGNDRIYVLQWPTPKFEIVLNNYINQ